MSDHEYILPALVNIANFKEQVWKSYFVTHRDAFENLVTKAHNAAERKKEIEETARKERTALQEVIDIFNDCFSFHASLR